MEKIIIIPNPTEEILVLLISERIETVSSSEGEKKSNPD